MLHCEDVEFISISKSSQTSDEMFANMLTKGSVCFTRVIERNISQCGLVFVQFPLYSQPPPPSPCHVLRWWAGADPEGGGGKGPCHPQTVGGAWSLVIMLWLLCYIMLYNLFKVGKCIRLTVKYEGPFFWLTTFTINNSPPPPPLTEILDPPLVVSSTSLCGLAQLMVEEDK